MSSLDVTLVISVFLASAVEGVEALTIVLAVGSARSWRSSLLGTGGALLSLAILVGLFGPALTALPLDVLRAFVGTFLLLFGLQWLRKAVLRACGALALHDEQSAFRRESDLARGSGHAERGIDRYSFTVAFKGVLLEGFEVVVIVISLGANRHRVGLATLAALASVALVAALGVAVKAPLARVPENTMKLIVGVMLSSFGIFWSAEGVGASWPLGEASLLVIALALAGCSLLLIEVLRTRHAVLRAGERGRMPGSGAIGALLAFLLGDDWISALSVLAMLGATAILARVVPAWYVLPFGTAVLLPFSVSRRLLVSTPRR